MDKVRPEKSKQKPVKQSSKRLALILAGKSLVSPNLTHSVETQTLDMQRRGSGGGSPQHLDLTRISAPETPTACLYPKWVTVECVHGNESAFPIRCGKCEGCRMHWRHKVRNLIKDGCRGHLSWFVTLTFREYPWQMGEDRYDFAQKRWHKLLRLCDKQNISFHYFRVVELQKRGTPHLHMVVNRVVAGGKKANATWMVLDMFRRLAKESGFGPQLKVESVQLGGKGAASYLSKYLSKQELWEMVRPDGRAIRRYSRSQGWCYDEKEKVWRYRRVGGLSNTEVLTPPLPCGCGDGLRLVPNEQAVKWLAKCVAEDRWHAPIGLFDWLHTSAGVMG